MTDQPYPDEMTITLPEPYLTAIGKVTVAWGHLESIVAMGLAKFTGYTDFDWRSATITAHMPWPQKMDAMETLINELTPENPHLAKFPEVKTLLKKAQEGRNRVSHGQWGYENGQASKARLTARGKLRPSIDPITVTEIETIASDIGRAAIRLWRLIVNK
jgi:hypothetical protein